MAWTTPRTWVTGETVTAAQLNAHVRDNLAIAYPSGTDWSTWSPSYSNLTIGNGTVDFARYIRDGDLVVARYSFTLGSTSAVGTIPLVSLPVASKADYGAGSDPVGSARCHENGGTSYYGWTTILNDADMVPQVINTASTYGSVANLTSTVPFTWGTSDILSMQVIYETA